MPFQSYVIIVGTIIGIFVVSPNSSVFLFGFQTNCKTLGGIFYNDDIKFHNLPLHKRTQMRLILRWKWFINL